MRAWLHVMLFGCCALWPRAAASQLSATQRARAEFLLRERLACLGCHSIDGKGGAIGPDLSAVGARRDAAAIRAIIADPQSQMPGTIMPRLPMSDDTRNRIVVYLAERKNNAPPKPQLATTRASANVNGAALYAQRCAVCHGARGRGDGANAANLNRKPAVHADGKLMGTRTDDRLFDGIYAGGIVLGVSPEMPAFGQTLSREQIWSLVRYIRELCKCRQPAWANAR
jgi:cytochrome c oxidase cbb3-type subunit III